MPEASATTTDAPAAVTAPEIIAPASFLTQTFLAAYAKPASTRTAAQSTLMESIIACNMAPFYHSCCHALSALPEFDAKVFDKMVATNGEVVAELDAKLKDAEENLGETEVADALRAIADHYARIGDKDAAVKGYKTAIGKTPSVGARIDMYFALARVSLVFPSTTATAPTSSSGRFGMVDTELYVSSLDSARELIEQGGDWDRRNKLKVYDAVHGIRKRDWTSAATHAVDALATFDCPEMCTFEELVSWAVILGAAVLDRADLKKKVIEAPEVLQVVHALPGGLADLASALYAANYAVFFRALADTEVTHLQLSPYFFVHTQYYVRMMRARAYKQILASYRALSLSRMATAFGVTPEWIERDVVGFIARGTLKGAMIDRVKGVVETRPVEGRMELFKEVVKVGDGVLSRVQKLGRVVHV